MKKLKIIIVGLLLLFAINVTSAQTIIKPSTAEYYLEVEDERDLLLVIDSVQDVSINKLKIESQYKDQIINAHMADELIFTVEYNQLVEDYNTQIDELNEQDKNILHQKRWKRIFAAAASGATVGALGGPAGGAVGAILGGVGGFVVDLVRRKKDK